MIFFDDTRPFSLPIGVCHHCVTGKLKGMGACQDETVFMLDVNQRAGEITRPDMIRVSKTNDRRV